MTHVLAAIGIVTGLTIAVLIIVHDIINWRNP